MYLFKQGQSLENFRSISCRCALALVRSLLHYTQNFELIFRNFAAFGDNDSTKQKGRFGNSKYKHCLTKHTFDFQLTQSMHHQEYRCVHLYFVYCTFYNKDYFQVIFCNIKIMPYLRLQTVEIVCKNKALLHDVISIVKIMLLNVAVFIVVQWKQIDVKLYKLLCNSKSFESLLNALLSETRDNPAVGIKHLIYGVTYLDTYQPKIQL